jgi:hypothetical protein
MSMKSFDSGVESALVMKKTIADIAGIQTFF